MKVFYKVYENMPKTDESGEVCFYQMKAPLGYLFIMHPDNLPIFLETSRGKNFDVQEYPTVLPLEEKPKEEEGEG